MPSRISFGEPYFLYFGFANVNACVYVCVEDHFTGSTNSFAEFYNISLEALTLLASYNQPRPQISSSYILFLKKYDISTWGFLSVY